MNVGERAGDYEIVEILGAGGMGKVYKVRNVLSDRVEAMKVLLPNLESDPDLVQRFLREIKVQAALDHPNIARLHTAQAWGNQLLMIMEYVQGSTIEKLLANGPMSVRDTVSYAMQVLDALAYAHERGVIHRDIKPPNVMLTAQGAVKLMDFGIARMQTDRRLTQTGHTVGSLFYMSPEQIKGSQPDPRSDLYSLGITMYEMATGRKPFEGNSDFSIMAAHLEQIPVAPIEVIPGIPPALSDIILMAVAKDPAARFQSAQAFRGALASIGGPAGTPSQVAMTAPAVAVPPPMPPPAPMPPPPVPQAYAAAPPPPPIPMPPPKPSSRRGLYMTLGSLATVGVIVAAIILVPKFRETSAAPQLIPQATPPAQGTKTQVEATPVVTPPATTTPPPVIAQPASAKPNLPPAVKQTPVAPVIRVQNPPASTTAPVAAQTPPPAAVQTPPPAAVSAPPKSTATASPELNELRDLYNMVSIRAGTSKAGLRNMETQMRRQGLDMRGDIVEAESRMDYLMKESMDSIRSGDAATARRNLQMAERAVETLEKFLGR